MPTSTAIVAAASAGAGLIAGWVLRSFMRAAALKMARARSRSQLMSEDDDGDFTDDEDLSFSDDGEYKMVIVIRNDLKMGKGKIAAQACHAACGSVKKLIKYNPEVLRNWEMCGQPKIATKVNDEQSLIKLAEQASSLGLVNQVIRDAGRTQIAPGSLTALAVGPGPNHLIDEVTGSLKLL